MIIWTYNFNNLNLYINSIKHQHLFTREIILYLFRKNNQVYGKLPWRNLYLTLRNIKGNRWSYQYPEGKGFIVASGKRFKMYFYWSADIWHTGDPILMTTINILPFINLKLLLIFYFVSILKRYWILLFLPTNKSTKIEWCIKIMKLKLIKI